MPRILGVLAQTYQGRPIPDDPTRARRVTEPFLQIKAVAEAFHCLPEPLDRQVSATEATRVLLSELQEGRIPPEADDAAVELVGWLELQLDDAPTVILTGISDPFLPESVNADPFLPNALRTRLGIEDNDGRYARDAYRLTALLHSAEKVVLVAGRRSGTGDPLRPSRLLLTGDDEELAARVLQLAGETVEGIDAAGTPSEDQDQTADERKPGTGPLFTLPPERELPLVPIPQPFPVTAFRQLLEDPYLWVLETVRRIESIDDEAQELDPPSFGILAHRVLDRFAQSEDARSTSASDIKRRLDAILDEVVHKTFAAKALPTVALQVEQLRTRLAAFSEFQADWAREGWVIEHSEAHSPVDGVPFEVDGVPIRLSGRVDRIDHNPKTGEWLLIDYKTGDRGAELRNVRSRDGTWKDLQLPLYRFLLPYLCTESGALDPSPKPGQVVKVAYLPIPRSRDAISPLIPNWKDPDFDSAVEAARDALRFLETQRVTRFDPLNSGRRARGAMGTLLGRGLLQDPNGEGQ
jgi:hypothetical protein